MINIPINAVIMRSEVTKDLDDQVPHSGCGLRAAVEDGVQIFR